MPKSTVKKSRLFREHSKLPEKYLGKNHLKNLRNVVKNFMEKNDGFTKAQFYFMLFVYDLEFFTISWAAEEYGYSWGGLADRIIYPLMSSDYIYKHFDKLTPSQVADDHLFRDETKYNYRVRYALSQKGRMAVQRFYNSF
jgi:hypothetical protein